MLIFTIICLLLIAAGSFVVGKEKGEDQLIKFVFLAFGAYFFVTTWWLHGFVAAIILIGLLLLLPPVGVMLLVGVVASIILEIAA